MGKLFPVTNLNRFCKTWRKISCSKLNVTVWWIVNVFFISKPFLEFIKIKYIFFISATSVHDVEAVLGKVAKLPCDIEPTVANDRIHIVIWFKEMKNKSDPLAKEKKFPIFS